MIYNGLETHVRHFCLLCYNTSYTRCLCNALFWAGLLAVSELTDDNDLASRHTRITGSDISLWPLVYTPGTFYDLFPSHICSCARLLDLLYDDKMRLLLISDIVLPYLHFIILLHHVNKFHISSPDPKIPH